MTQGTPTGALQQSRRVGCGGKWEEVEEEGQGYTYSRFLLMFDRKQQNSVKQLSFS